MAHVLRSVRWAVIGASDCETVGDGVIAQPVAFWTSLAYVAVGLWIVRRAVVGRRGPWALGFGMVVSSVGLGSMAFHGPMPGWARWVHDVTIVVAFLWVAAGGGSSPARTPSAGVLAAAVGAAIGAGVLTALAPDTGVALIAVAVALAVITEIRTFRLRPADGRRPDDVRLALGIGGLLAFGALLNVLGRTGAPLCDPDGLLQLHGAWHLATAAALGLWAQMRLVGPVVQDATVSPR